MFLREKFNFVIVDTDIIIRYLTSDDPKKASRFEAFLQSGKKMQLSDVTFAEVYWTLASFYKIKKPEILLMLESFIALPAVVSNSSILSRAIGLLRQHTISFIDAYAAAVAMSSDKTILSFDRDFDKIEGIKRIEP